MFSINPYYHKIIRIFSTWKSCTRVNIQIPNVIDNIVRFTYTERSAQTDHIIEFDNCSNSDNHIVFRTELKQNDMFKEIERIIKSYKKRLSLNINEMITILDYVTILVCEYITEPDFKKHVQDKYTALNAFYTSHKLNYVVNAITITNTHFVKILLDCKNVRMQDLELFKQHTMCNYMNAMKHEFREILSEMSDAELEYEIKSNCNYGKLRRLCDKIRDVPDGITCAEIIHGCVLTVRGLKKKFVKTIQIDKGDFWFLPNVVREPKRAHTILYAKIDVETANLSNKKLRGEYANYCEELDKDVCVIGTDLCVNADLCVNTDL